MPTLLSPAQRASLPDLLPRWSLVPGRDAIERHFQFVDFSEAWAFMSRVALLAEAHNHHPEWSNVWSRVHIALSTHDCGGLSEKDLALAAAIDHIAGQR
jgi:4a-hydroxytetrahydrobiopterin dehydratase